MSKALRIGGVLLIFAVVVATASRLLPPFFAGMVCGWFVALSTLAILEILFLGYRRPR